MKGQPINYGMSANSIKDMLFSDDDTMTDEEKLKKATAIQDKLVKGLPQLQKAILQSQQRAARCGYTETILGRRRHLPNMQLPPFQFEPKPGYMNPDVDPLDPETMNNKDQIPERIVKKLTHEFNNLKYYGQIVKRTKQLDEENIRVINNRSKIAEASRECFNGVIQGEQLHRPYLSNLITQGCAA